jgi:hypothetical protein
MVHKVCYPEMASSLFSDQFHSVQDYSSTECHMTQKNAMRLFSFLSELRGIGTKDEEDPGKSKKR